MNDSRVTPSLSRLNGRGWMDGWRGTNQLSGSSLQHRGSRRRCRETRRGRRAQVGRRAVHGLQLLIGAIRAKMHILENPWFGSDPITQALALRAHSTVVVAVVVGFVSNDKYYYYMLKCKAHPPLLLLLLNRCAGQNFFFSPSSSSLHFRKQTGERRLQSSSSSAGLLLPGRPPPISLSLFSMQLNLYYYQPSATQLILL